MQLRTFKALRSRDFRYLMLAHVGTGMTLWMDLVVRSWLVWQLTADPFSLGLVSLFQAIPYLICALPAGIIIDRFDKKRVLIVCQAVTLLLHLILGTLVATGAVQLWQVFLTAFLEGTAQAFVQPTRHCLVPLLVKKDEVTAAIALSGGANNTTRIVGPSIAGALVGLVGIAPVYYIMASVFVLVIIATETMRVPAAESCDATPPVLENLREGFSYVRHNPIVLTLLIVSLVPMVFGQPYATLLPVFADKVFSIGASGLGLLTAAPGMGSVVGAVAVASAGNFRRRGWVLLGGAFAFGFFLVMFAVSRWLPVSLALLVAVGLSATSYNAICISLLLSIPPAEFRGRVMSIFMMDRGLVPFGSVLLGAMAAQWSAPLAIAVSGSACALLALIVGFRVPSVRRLE
ncbi:MAG: MFS transporter [Chloroflexi bacterium]|nr:MFS transporter [Chloroflexota bacterium]